MNDDLGPRAHAVLVAATAGTPGSSTLVVAADDPGILDDDTGTGRDVVLVVRDLHRHRAARDVVAAAVASRPDAIVVEMGVPVLDPGGRAWVTSSGASAASVGAVCRLLLGRRRARGVSLRAAEVPR